MPVFWSRLFSIRSAPRIESAATADLDWTLRWDGNLVGRGAGHRVLVFCDDVGWRFRAIPDSDPDLQEAENRTPASPIFANVRIAKLEAQRALNPPPAPYPAQRVTDHYTP